MFQIYTLQRACKKCGKMFVIHNPRSYYCNECHSQKCVVCNKTFKITANFDQQTCSFSCRSKLHAIKNRPRKSLICEWCGTTFLPSNRHLRTKFCSQECRYKSKQKEEDTGKHSGWRYEHWRKAVLKRDDYTCQECKSKKMVGAHHIKTWKDYPELRYVVDNGQSLCSVCHKNVHRVSSK